MKQVLIIMLLWLGVASCGPEPTQTPPPAMVSTGEVEPKYAIGQYVYIHGEIKGIVKNNTRDNCGCSNDAQYKVVVAGNDGSSHIWYVNDDELSPTRDTSVLKVIVTDSMQTVIYKNTLTSNEMTQKILDEDRAVMKAIKQAISNGNHSEIK